MSLIPSNIRRFRDDIQTGAAILATSLLLLYTWFHTGSLLARYIVIWPIGYVAAAGIEVAIVSLSLRLGQVGWKAQGTAVYKAALIMALVVSALANIAEGYAAMYTPTGAKAPALLTWKTLWRIDIVQGVLGIAATGLISILVYALADGIGGDVAHAQDERADFTPVATPPALDLQPLYSLLSTLHEQLTATSERLATLETRPAPDVTPLYSLLEDVNCRLATLETTGAPVATRALDLATVFPVDEDDPKQQALDMWMRDVRLSTRRVGEAVGVSHTQAGKWRKEFEDGGLLPVVAKSGNGNGHHA